MEVGARVPDAADEHRRPQGAPAHHERRRACRARRRRSPARALAGPWPPARRQRRPGSSCGPRSPRTTRDRSGRGEGAPAARARTHRLEPNDLLGLEIRDVGKRCLRAPTRGRSGLLALGTRKPLREEPFFVPHRSSSELTPARSASMIVHRCLLARVAVSLLKCNMSCYTCADGMSTTKRPQGGLVSEPAVQVEIGPRVLDAAIRVLAAARLGAVEPGTRRRRRRHLARHALASGCHPRSRWSDALLARLAIDYRDTMWAVLTASGTGRERLEGALEALCVVADRHLDLLLPPTAPSTAPGRRPSRR